MQMSSPGWVGFRAVSPLLDLQRLQDCQPRTFLLH